MEASIRTTSGRNFRPVIMTTSLPFQGKSGEWYDQGAWLMEVVSRSPALSQSLENYLPERVKVPLLKKDFAVDAVYDKSRYFLLRMMPASALLSLITTARQSAAKEKHTAPMSGTIRKAPSFPSMTMNGQAMPTSGHMKTAKRFTAISSMPTT